VTEQPLEPHLCFRIIDGAIVLPQSSHERQLLTISAATCAESSLLAFAAGYIVIATALGASSSAALSWASATSRIDDPGLARYVAARAVFALALILITASTLLPHLHRPHFFHGIAGLSRTPSSAYANQRTAKSGQLRSETFGAAATDARDAYSGIVLWPKKQVHTKLIAPSPMSWNQKLVSNPHSNPLSIPFEGAYWLFREPDVQPPPKSRQAEGSPEMFEMHSTDWRPLSMEAHQNFGTLIELDCCGKIQVAIRNADVYPTSISLELILFDTTARGKPSQSLGRVNIVSDGRWKPGYPPHSKSETLHFFIPPNCSIHRFNEVTLLFHLDGFRARAAAKIGIDHFTLVPRRF
jgi:hypothetical protein